MKTLIVLVALIASVTSLNASADHGGYPPPPGYGYGPGAPDRGGDRGPGWGGDRGGDRGPGWGGDRGGDRGPGWGGGHGGGGPGWGGGHGGGGPGWGGGHGGGGGPGWGNPPPPAPREQYVSCSSGGYNYSACPVNGQIQSARLVSQQSMASCQLGNSFGWQGNTLWVNRGCRGTFVVYTY